LPQITTPSSLAAYGEKSVLTFYTKGSRANSKVPITANKTLIIIADHLQEFHQHKQSEPANQRKLEIAVLSTLAIETRQ